MIRVYKDDDLEKVNDLLIAIKKKSKYFVDIKLLKENSGNSYQNRQKLANFIYEESDKIQGIMFLKGHEISILQSHPDIEDLKIKNLFLDFAKEHLAKKVKSRIMTAWCLLEDKETIDYYKDQGGKIKPNLKMKRYEKDYIFSNGI